MENNKLIKDSLGDRVFTIVNILFSIMFLAVCSYPLIYVFSASISSPQALISGKVWLFPVDLSLEGYKAVVQYSKVWTGYGNSLFYTIVGTAINLVLTIAAAYPLSRKDLKGKNFIMLMFTFTMIFSGGMIPSYLLVNNLGLINSRWALLIPNAMSVYNVIVTTTFFKSNIPEELLESAKLDGCTDMRFLTSIVLPLSGAIIAVMTLFYSVSHWNSYFDALMYISDPKKFPLQIILREILLLNTASELTTGLQDENARLYLNELLKYSLIIVASVPLLLLYPFVQKYFVKGVMIGSIKG